MDETQGVLSVGKKEILCSAEKREKAWLFLSRPRFTLCHLLFALGCCFIGSQLGTDERAIPGEPVEPQALSTALEERCDIAAIRLEVDQRVSGQAMVVKAKIGSPYPSYEQLYAQFVNKRYDPEDNMFSHFETVNPYNKTNNMRFPYSNLREHHLDQLHELLGRKPRLMVEAGSFHGHSAILQAKYMKNHGMEDVPLICFDPWTGDLAQMLFRDEWDSKLTPGEYFDGRSTSYWQFMANVKYNIDQGTIGSKAIFPVVTTSLMAARFLTAVEATPDLIYLDSAHEIDETFAELKMFYHALAPGGVLFGDDWTWYAVSHDVTRFTAKHGLEVRHLDGVTWAIKKPLK